MIVLRDQSTGLERLTNTDGEGRFSFAGLATSKYEIVARANGFAKGSELVEGERADLLFTLEPAMVAAEVSVTAARTEIASIDTAVPLSVIDRESIERKNINTVGDLFRGLPGTSTTNEGAFQVRPRIRGLESNRVLILVDGERLNNSRTSAQSGIEPGLVETSQIDSVEVIRGSGSGAIRDRRVGRYDQHYHPRHAH